MIRVIELLLGIGIASLTTKIALKYDLPIELDAGNEYIEAIDKMIDYACGEEFELSNFDAWLLNKAINSKMNMMELRDRTILLGR